MGGRSRGTQSRCGRVPVDVALCSKEHVQRHAHHDGPGVTHDLDHVRRRSAGATLAARNRGAGYRAGVEQCLSMEKSDITPELVCRLLATQFPEWAHLPIRRVDVDGWDNATFRLGRHMSVRLPSSQAYV